MKKKYFSFLVSFGVAAVLMLLFRALVVTVYDVPGSSLSPVFEAGDRVMVNRWSYGLRVGGNSLLGYNRLWRRPVQRGDLVVINDPSDTLNTAADDRRILIVRCTAVPGDTVNRQGRTLVVPGRETCADGDYYWVTSLNAYTSPDSRHFGLVPEDHIIGRPFLIIYNHTPTLPFWDGWRSDRILCGLRPK
ncbi:MAG: signal peptidase I [Prevotella sp.]|nr:signal peptidase I [Prevotella sp.]